MIEGKRKILLTCAKCGSTDFLIKKEEHGESFITSVTCLKCANKISPRYLTFKTIPLLIEDEALR